MPTSSMRPSVMMTPKSFREEFEINLALNTN